MTGMIDQIEEEMEKRGFDSILSWADTTNDNPTLQYLVGANIARETLYIKQAGKPPILMVHPLDLGTAKKSHIRDIRTFGEYERHKLIEKYGIYKGMILFFEKLLKELKMKGTIGILGKTEASRTIKLTSELQKKGFHIEGDWQPDLAESLRETKDATEIEKLAEVARLTEKVVTQTMDYLKNCKISNGKLTLRGETVATGKVKALISRLIIENGITEPEETIFAVGADGADPHNPGNPRTPVQTGVPIVFDIFPKHRNGYWNDMTRTYCLGKPSAKLKQYYANVLEAQTWALDALEVGKPYRKLADGVCSILERQGHPTYRTHIKAGTAGKMSTGFIHGVGHGVGLTIGEPPSYSSTSEDKVKIGQVVTDEPGVYYPGWGGVRIEDTVAIIGRSKIRNFNKLSKELEP